MKLSNPTRRTLKLYLHRVSHRMRDEIGPKVTTRILEILRNETRCVPAPNDMGRLISLYIQGINEDDAVCADCECGEQVYPEDLE